MGGQNKLLKNYEGKPLVAHILSTLKSSTIENLAIITGHDRETIEKLALEYEVPSIHCRNFSKGMAESLKAGVEHFSNSDGIMICLGDMPHIRLKHINALLTAFRAHEGQRICIAAYHAKRGNPVILPKDIYPYIAELEGDQGARVLFSRFADRVELVEMDDSAVIEDFDDPSAFEQH
jgi:molybdenum cofactor cytidylyltransferase